MTCDSYSEGICYGNQYLYDADGHVCAVGSPFSGMWGYLYDAEGRRIAKGAIQNMNTCDPAPVSQGGNGFQLASSYALDDAGEQMSEYAMDTNGTLAWQHTNVWSAGQLIATFDTNGLHFYLNDPLGTRRVQTDYAGVVEQTCYSLPYGNGESCGTTPTEHLFTGKERDAESGNDYFGARYYSSLAGRFLTPDWSAKVEPVPYAKLDNPQSLNLYAYVDNNPLSRIDADGHCGASDPNVCTNPGSTPTSGSDLIAQWQTQIDQQNAHNSSGEQAQQQQTTGNIVYNETGGLRPKAKDGSGSSQDLHDSRVAVADVIDNRNKAGAKGGVASDAVSPKERHNAQYKDSQAAASEAANSPDRTGGSTHFYLDYGQPKPNWANGKVTTSYGPFVNAAGGGDVPKGADVRIVIVHPEDQQ